jgi:MFS family permease
MQGIGGGGMATLTYMIVADLTTLRERPKWMSLLSLAYAFGNLGLLIGAAITQHTTWRW